MEDVLTLNELQLLVQTARDRKHEEQKFMAALKGIDLDAETKENSSFEDIKRKAEAQLAGKGEDEMFFEEVGIMIESD